MPSYYAGLDLGQRHDYTALVLIERTQSKPVQSYAVRQADRTVQESYEDVADKIAAYVASERLAGCTELTVDETGVGNAVVDMFRRRGLSFSGVSITSGNSVRQEGSSWFVPKRDLVATVDVLLDSGRLAIPPHLPEAAALTRELENFRYKITAAGNDTYGAPDWRVNSHDDLVLAVALACWRAEHPAVPITTGVVHPVAATLRRPASIFDAPAWAEDEDDALINRARRRR